MVHTIEFHGHLQRADGRPVEAGQHSLCFRLHARASGDDGALWEETLRRVAVRPGGSYHVVLGTESRLQASLFDDAPRWLCVRVVSGGDVEAMPGRAAVTGAAMRLASAVDALIARVEDVERREPIPLPMGRAVDPVMLRRRTMKLHRRLQVLEKGGGVIATAATRVAALEGRVARLDGEEGRVMHLEDELEDIIGADGDIVDLTDRMDRIEGKAPELIASLSRLRANEEPSTPRMRVAEERMIQIEARLHAVEARPNPPPPTPEALGVVKKTGDSMYGALVIQKGGIQIVSGGLKTRSAEANTLNIDNALTAKKIIVDALELRGDLTVDHTKRAIQVRFVEGRAGAGRKDGPLHLNGRSGEAVVVGRTEQAAGMHVHGAVRADSHAARGRGVAEAFECDEVMQPGEVAILLENGKVARAAVAADPRVIGVVVDGPGLALGIGKTLVAITGVVRVKIVGACAPGDRLVASVAIAGFAAVAAAPAAGTILGKALSSRGDGKGDVLALLMQG